MNQSEQINELLTALSKAQLMMRPAKHNRKGQYSKYADLDSIWDAIREPLGQNGLSILQPFIYNDHGLIIITTLGHTSGQWIRSEIRPVYKEQTFQSIGGAITFFRRYALVAMVGIGPGEDSDDEVDSKIEESSNQKHSSLVSDKQVEALLSLIKGDNYLLQRVLDFNKVGRLEELTVEQFEKAFKSLSANRAKAAS